MHSIRVPMWQTRSVWPVRTAHISVLRTVNIVSHNPAQSYSDNIPLNFLGKMEILFRSNEVVLVRRSFQQHQQFTWQWNVFPKWESIATATQLWLLTRWEHITIIRTRLPFHQRWTTHECGCLIALVFEAVTFTLNQWPWYTNLI